jgi:hypothetical protein
MKLLFAGALLTVVGVGAGAMVLRERGPVRTQPSTRTPVVVELFTSEGCSSCPPADSLLATLADKQPIENAEIIALEEHVDYWNDLGWADPFSSKDWTARQYDYAGVLGNVNAYTPQMVVDGKTEFVGSSERKARQAIVEASGQEKALVTLTPAKPAGGADRWSIQIGSLPKAAGSGAEVWLATTETGLHSAVTRGENAGEDLHHAAVVRAMRRIGEARAAGDVSFSEVVDVPLRREWNRDHVQVVVFLQDRKSRHILGAAQAPVSR